MTEGPYVSGAWAPRTVVTGGGVMIAGFLGLALWGLQDPAPRAPAPSAPRVAKRAPVPVQETAKPAPTRPSEPPAPAPDDSPGGALRIPRELPGLLAQRFQFTRKDGKAGFTQLRSALGPERAVTVLNVWAPYCEPCKREFPAFRDLQRVWRDDVRFMPIQLGEGDPGPLASLMPDAQHHLIDYVPGGAVQRELGELDLIGDLASIPITLLLDCKNQLRWVKAREVTDMAAFARAVDELRAELDTTSCARAQGPVAPEGCGNGVCEPLERGEDCLRCAADCGCRKNQLCATQVSEGSGLGHVCMDELQ